MPVFVWEGKTAQGKILKGEMEAASQDAVFARLRSQRIQPIPARVREKGKGLEKEFTIPGFGAKVSAHDVSEYFIGVQFWQQRLGRRRGEVPVRILPERLAVIAGPVVHPVRLRDAELIP
ncbi:MAG: hypothetical protein AAB154_03130 [Candidatus Binatota bacterium]